MRKVSLGKVSLGKVSLGKVSLGVAAALVGVYLVGVWWFSSHWVPGSTINGINVDSLTDDEAAVLLVGEVTSWQGSVTSAGGFSLELTGDDVGLTANGAAMAADARSHENAWLWPWLIANPPVIQVQKQATVDAEKVSTLVESAVSSFNETAAGPTNASITYDGDAAAFVIEPASLGERLNAEAVCASVEIMASSLVESLELDETVREQPAFSEDDDALVAARDKANVYLEHEVTLNWEGSALTHVDAAKIHEWVRIGEDWKVTLDTDTLRAWIDETCSDAVKHQDDLHYYGLDLDQACNDVLSVLEGDTQMATVELTSEIVEDKPPLSEGADKRGRHLDVNLTTQYARFYDSSGRIIWESYIVSGNLATDHGTPTGDFSILRKQRSRTLVGADEDGDGKPDYRSYVEYWMLFREGGYGLHDASWRDSFGGDIYTYDGSHGCVNLPPTRAAELYDIVNVGDRVYVHW